RTAAPPEEGVGAALPRPPDRPRARGALGDDDRGLRDVLRGAAQRRSPPGGPAGEPGDGRVRRAPARARPAGPRPVRDVPAPPRRGEPRLLVLQLDRGPEPDPAADPGHVLARRR